MKKSIFVKNEKGAFVKHISYAVTIEGEGVSVKNGDIAIKNGDIVEQNTVLTVTIADKEGYTGTVKVGDEIVKGTWTVTGDVAFTGSYVEDSSDSKSDNTTTIIIAAVVVVIIAGLAGFFILKRH